MNTPLVVKSFRYVIANDAILRLRFKEITEAGMLFRLLYKDASYVSLEDVNSTTAESEYKYPAIVFKINDDEDLLRGSDSNTIFVEMTIINSYANNASQTVNMLIKDRLKTIMKDKHEILNAQALSSFSEILKCRDLAWVSAISYDDKTQGTQRLNKITCLLKAIVGD
jgi:hypothetical protein